MSREITTELVTDRGGMATIFGVSINHINKLVSRGMPRLARGQYSIPDCVQWMVSDTTSKSGVDPDELPAVVEARTKLYVAQEQNKRLQNRILERSVIDADEVVAALYALSSIMVTALEGMPVRAAADLAATRTTAEAQSKLLGYCHAVRADCAGKLESLADAVQTGVPIDAAAADPDGEPVGGRGTPRAARVAKAGAVAE